MCLVGRVVAFWSLSQKGSRFEPFYCIDKYFSETFRKNSIAGIPEATCLLYMACNLDTVTSPKTDKLRGRARRTIQDHKP